MTSQQIAENSKTLEAYDALFGNADELMHPGVVMNPRFYVMLKSAIDSNTRLTWDKVRDEFGALGWEM